MRILITLFAILLLPAMSFSQKKRMSVDELKKLGRDSLIKMAVKEINDSTFHPEHYDRIVVKANDTQVWVSFSLSVVLKTKKPCYYDAVGVDLANGTVSRSHSNNDCDEAGHYKPTKSIQKKIDFVFNAINKSDEVGDLPGNKVPYGTTMDISEHPTYYYVEVSSYSTFSHYKVDKITGKIYDAGHKHYARDFMEEEKWEIIK
jgi:hypothetical protein